MWKPPMSGTGKINGIKRKWQSTDRHGGILENIISEKQKVVKVNSVNTCIALNMVDPWNC